MAQLDTQRVLSCSIILLQYAREKTISGKAIQAAFRMCYIDDKNITERGVSEATKYCTLISSSTGVKLETYKNQINYDQVENIIRDFLREINERDPNNKFKLAQNAICYLGGLIASFN